MTNPLEKIEELIKDYANGVYYGEDPKRFNGTEMKEIRQAISEHFISKERLLEEIEKNKNILRNDETGMTGEYNQGCEDVLDELAEKLLKP